MSNRNAGGLAARWGADLDRPGRTGEPRRYAAELRKAIF